VTELAPNPEVAPDLRAIAQHVELLFGRLEGYVPLRLLPERGAGDGHPKNSFHPIRDGYVETILRLARTAHLEQRGVFVVPAR
jgi:hypothetical protein